MGYSEGILVGHGAVLALSRHSRCSSSWAIISLPLFVTQEETFPKRVAGTGGPSWDCLGHLRVTLSSRAVVLDPSCHELWVILGHVGWSWDCFGAFQAIHKFFLGYNFVVCFWDPIRNEFQLFFGNVGPSRGGAWATH